VGLLGWCIYHGLYIFDARKYPSFSRSVELPPGGIGSKIDEEIHRFEALPPLSTFGPINEFRPVVPAKP
jgi:hypothetical protein